MARRQRTSITGKDNFAIEGADSIAAMLGDIEREVRRTIAIDALDKAADPIFADMKNTSSFSDKSGGLRGSMEKIRRKSSIALRAGGQGVINAGWVEFGHGGPRGLKGRGRTTVGGKFGKHKVAAGTLVPRTKKALVIAPGVVRASAKPGIARPRPFIRPAFDNNSERAFRIMAEEMARGIQRVIKRTLAA